ncbi:heme biosynthesis HemY N-terminal domain-containing protein, partial [Lysobacter zhanggongensis]
MSLFRNLLILIVLVLVGALVAQLLVQDPGYVLVRYRGMDYTTTLAAAVLIGLGALLALWLVWKMLSMPLVALRRRRERAVRARFTDGLEALHLGHWQRAERLLDETARHPAADDDGVTAIARVGAARAA